MDLVVLDQAIDTTTPAGRLLFHVLAAISEFERDLIRDRVLAGLKWAKAQGVRLGRPRPVVDVLRARTMLADGKCLRQVSLRLAAAKEGDLTKQQVSSLFHRSLVFPHAFLSSLDETLLRPA